MLASGPRVRRYRLISFGSIRPRSEGKHVLKPDSVPHTAGSPNKEPVLQVESLSVDYLVNDVFGRSRGVVIRAVDRVSFQIGRAETVGLVGESGSGKSTIGKAILRFCPVKSGSIVLEGQNLLSMKGEELRRTRSRLQMVFQDPAGSLNPRMTLAEIVAEPLIVHGRSLKAAALARASELLAMCELPNGFAKRYPQSLSGGQKQRVALARALALEPSLIIADEPTSALDVSVQAQLLNLMLDLQQELGLSYLFISHDLATVRYMSHRIMVMYAGRIVEDAPTERIYLTPFHPYTRALLAASPVPNPNREATRERGVLVGEMADPAHLPSGCAFHPRCPLRANVLQTESANASVARFSCTEEEPLLSERQMPQHRAACWLS